MVVRGAAGHYPGAVSPVKRMIPAKALLVSLPLVAGGGIFMGRAHTRLTALRAELATVDAQGRAEAASYLQTLQGAHAERELAHLTRRHEVALQLAAARRDRLLGLVAMVGGALAFLGVRAAERVAGEIREAERLSERLP